MSPTRKPRCPPLMRRSTPEYQGRTRNRGAKITKSSKKTNDPVRMYLREMGTVPLLTREGEVAIAKRIERGQNLVY
jgi:DNA-directed RNA polymerase sigma subunit (sigma70/sigma32)